jgi:hypothetical protein
MTMKAKVGSDPHYLVQALADVKEGGKADSGNEKSGREIQYRSHSAWRQESARGSMRTRMKGSEEEKCGGDIVSDLEGVAAGRN